MFKILVLIILILVISSCDEEEAITKDNSPIEEVEEEEEEKVLLDSIVPFKIKEIYPPYAFWESGIKITLDKNKNFDPSKLEIYYNDTLLPKIQVNNANDKYIILTKMFNNSFSDKFVFKYNMGDTTINIESDHYEIVNSEVRIDSVEKTLCGEYKKVYGKGFRYLKHIGMQTFQTDNLLAVYGKTPKSLPKGEMINDNEALFKFIQGHDFIFYLSVSDSILSPKHPYPTNRSFKISENQGYFNINTPKVRKVVRKGQKVTIESELWFYLTKEDIIKFGNVIIDRSKISFNGHYIREEYSDYSFDYITVYSYLNFEIPDNAQNDILEIEFGCSDKVYKQEVIKGTEFKSAEIYCEDITAYYKFDKYIGMFGDDSISTYNIDTKGMVSEFKYPTSYLSHDNSFNKLDIFEMNEDFIRFKIYKSKSHYVSGNNGGSGFDDKYIDYEGSYIREEVGNHIIIHLNNNHLENVKISGRVFEDITGGAVLVDKSIYRYEVDDDWYLKIILEKW